MPDSPSKRILPPGMAETSPLAVGIVGISIPVALIATACVTKSVVVLILAVIAMFCVGAATLSFVLFLASEEPDDEGEPGDAHAPAATNQA